VENDIVSDALRAVIAAFEQASPVLDKTAVELRALMAPGEGATPPPLGTEIVAVRAGDAPAEWVSAPGAGVAGAMLYLHGGGYCIGSLATHRHLVGHLSLAAGLRCLALDYRLAPEHPFPAALDDALAAYRWLLAAGVAPRSLVVAGDSAGGGLALAMLVALRDGGTPLPAAAVCLSPWVDLGLDAETLATNAGIDPLVTRAGLAQMARDYLAGADPRTPLASPLYADLGGLPPLLVHVGGREVLLDDARRLAVRARAAGVAVTLEIWPNAVHCWHVLVPDVPEATRAVARAGDWVRARLAEAATR